jgi:hypothetical protein
MLSRLRIFPQSEAPVLTLFKPSQLHTVRHPKTQFELLVRHLLDRFFNNETISVGGDTVPLIMTVAWTIALPTLVMAIFCYPFYHAFPPHPHVPPFWLQVSDHYFFVMYSFVAMGVVTAFEWDLLFPNVLDIFVLSILPISNRRLLIARMSAVFIFLALFLAGTGSVGIIALPAVTELPGVRLFVAHFVAIILSGTFTAALLLSLQGILINLLGARLFRVASTFTQGISVAILLIILFLFPLLSRSLQPLISSDSLFVRWFPPFWFLGIYESVFAGKSTLPVFTKLAHTGYQATSLLLVLAIATYPMAYRRRARQAIEGSVAQNARNPFTQPIIWLLHRTVLRNPAQRAIYHFIGQTLLRTQRHRVYLAMYAGLGAALIFTCSVVLRVDSQHVSVIFSVYGLRLAIPALAFWTVAGLRTSLTSAADSGGSWVFRSIHGRPSIEHLTATRIWVLVRTVAITLGAVAAFHFLAPPELRTVRETAVQVTVAAGLSLLLTDAFFLQVRTIPFTEARVPLNTDLPLVLLHYIVVFPAVVLTTVNCEPWIEANPGHLILVGLLVVALHILMCRIHRQIVTKQISRSGYEEDEFLVTLDLRG